MCDGNHVLVDLHVFACCQLQLEQGASSVLEKMLVKLLVIFGEEAFRLVFLNITDEEMEVKGAVECGPVR